jgi:hypothetical protein
MLADTYQFADRFGRTWPVAVVAGWTPPSVASRSGREARFEIRLQRQS